jgi:hypothetical protein
LADCLRTYRSDLGWVALAIIISCLVTAIALAPFTGGLTLAAIAKCLALGVVGEVTGGLTSCILKCARRSRGG